MSEKFKYFSMGGMGCFSVMSGKVKGDIRDKKVITLPPVTWWYQGCKFPNSLVYYSLSALSQRSEWKELRIMTIRKSSLVICICVFWVLFLAFYEHGISSWESIQLLLFTSGFVLWGIQFQRSKLSHRRLVVSEASGYSTIKGIWWFLPESERYGLSFSHACLCISNVGWGTRGAKDMEWYGKQGMNSILGKLWREQMKQCMGTAFVVDRHQPHTR